MVMLKSCKYRILVVDDEQIIVDIYREILTPEHDEDTFELVICRQGDEAVKQVENALEEGKPFSVVFLDVRMPPGPDGVWAAQQIHALDPRINIVIVTAYSDVPPQVISQSFEMPARLFYIKKPFHVDEIYQFAVALSENWEIQEELTGYSDFFEELVENQTSALNIAQRDVLDVQEKLSIQTRHVEDVNTALRVLLGERERDKKNIKDNIIFNVNEHILPYISKLEKTELTARQKLLISTMQTNLNDITSSFSPKMAAKRLNFTPSELQVAKLIKHGSSNKDIADMLNLSVLTIESCRKKIRQKMGLTNTKENLRTHLLEYF